MHHSCTIFFLNLRSTIEMKMSRKFIALVLFLFIGQSAVQAQYRTNASRSEIGFMVGGSYYIGDLNPFMPYRNTNLAGGLVYRYNIHSRLSFRANLTYGKLEGYDSDSKEALLVDRNLSFHTNIFELGAGIEFNYFPFQLGHDRYKGTAYVLTEIALFRMNPKTIADDGGEIDLQPLGTEGQGSSLNSKSYGLTQLVIPIGLGAKISLGKKASINFEVGLRKTFTDYIDDIGSGSYVDPTLLAAENGPLSAELSNRSLSGSRFGRRGNASTNDWYVFSGVMFTFRLGSPVRCNPQWK